MASTFVSLRMPDDLLENARSLAQAEDRSLSSVVRQAVRQHVGPNPGCACVERVLSEDDGRWCTRCHLEVKQ
jgi:predicted transcriptional regulator